VQGWEIVIGDAGSAAAEAIRAAGEALELESREDLGMPDFSMREELERPFLRLTVARSNEDGAALGFVIGWAVADELHVLHVVVRRSARRLGVGRALLTAAASDAKSKDASIVLLEVRRSNTAAIRLYRSLGFVAIDVRKAYYRNGEDAVQMALGLVPGALEPFGEPLSI
jgi:ribosomal-protein-alanine N-acetyltransferase